MHLDRLIKIGLTYLVAAAACAGGACRAAWAASRADRAEAAAEAFPSRRAGEGACRDPRGVGDHP